MAKNTIVQSVAGEIGRPIIAYGKNMERHIRCAYEDGVVFPDVSGSKSWWMRNVASPAIATANLSVNLPLRAAHLPFDAHREWRRLHVDKKNGKPNNFANRSPMLMVISENSMTRNHNDRARLFPRVLNQRTRIATRAYQRQGGHILLNDSTDLALAEAHLSTIGAGSKSNVTIVSNYGACVRSYDTNGKPKDKEEINSRLSPDKVKLIREMFGTDIQGEDSVYMLNAHDGTKKQCIVTAEPNSSDALSLLKYRHNARQSTFHREVSNENQFTTGTTGAVFYNIEVKPQPARGNIFNIFEDSTNQPKPIDARMDNIRMLLNIAKARSKLEATYTEKQNPTAAETMEYQSQLQKFQDMTDLEIQFGKDGTLVFTNKGISKRNSTQDVADGLGVHPNDVGMRITSVADVIPSFTMQDVYLAAKKYEAEFRNMPGVSSNVAQQEIDNYVANKMLEQLYKPDPAIFQINWANSVYNGSSSDSELAELTALRERYAQNAIADKEASDSQVKASLKVILDSRIDQLLFSNLSQEIETLREELDNMGGNATEEQIRQKSRELRAHINYHHSRVKHMQGLLTTLFDLEPLEVPNYPNDATIVGQIFRMQDLSQSNLGQLPPDEQARQAKRKDAVQKLEEYLQSQDSDENKTALMNQILVLAINIKNGNSTYMQTWDNVISAVNDANNNYAIAQAAAKHQDELMEITNIDTTDMAQAMDKLANNLESLLNDARNKYDNNVEISAEQRELIDTNIKKMLELKDAYLGEQSIPAIDKVHMPLIIDYYQKQQDIIKNSKNDVRYQERLDAEENALTLLQQSKAILAISDTPATFFDKIEADIDEMLVFNKDVNDPPVGEDKIPLFSQDLVLNQKQKAHREVMLARLQNFENYYKAGLEQHRNSFRNNAIDYKYRKEMAKKINYVTDLATQNIPVNNTTTREDKYKKIDELDAAKDQAMDVKIKYDQANNEERTKMLTEFLNDTADKLNAIASNALEETELMEDYQAYILEFRRVRNDFYAQNPVEPEVYKRDNIYVELITSHYELLNMDAFIATQDQTTTEGLQAIETERNARTQRYLDAQEAFANLQASQIAPAPQQVYNITNNFNYNQVYKTINWQTNYLSMVSIYTFLSQHFINIVEDARTKKEEEDNQKSEDELPNGRRLVKLQIDQRTKEEVEARLAELHEIHKELIKTEFGINEENKDQLIKELVSGYNTIKTLVDKGMQKEYRLNNVAKYTLNAIMGLHENYGGNLKRNRQELQATSKETWEQYKNDNLTNRVELELIYIQEILNYGVEVDKSGNIFIRDTKVANKKDTQQILKENVNKQLSSTANPYSFIIEYSQAKIEDAKRREKEAKHYEDFLTTTNDPRRRSSIALKVARKQLEIFQEIQNGVVDKATMHWELSPDTNSIVLTLAPEPNKNITIPRKIHIYESEVKAMGIDYHELCDNIIKAEQAKLDAADRAKQAELDEQQKKVDDKRKEEKLAEEDAKHRAMQINPTESAKTSNKEPIMRIKPAAKSAETSNKEPIMRIEPATELAETSNKEPIMRIKPATEDEKHNKKYAKLQTKIEALTQQEEELYEIIESTSGADKFKAKLKLGEVTLALQKCEDELQAEIKFMESMNKLQEKANHDAMQKLAADMYSKYPPQATPWEQMAGKKPNYYEEAEKKSNAEGYTDAKTGESVSMEKTPPESITIEAPETPSASEQIPTADDQLKEQETSENITDFEATQGINKAS